jgi:tetratricopeptide (TPR) repeat protein
VFVLALAYERQGKYSDAENVLLEEVNAEEQQGNGDIRLAEALRRMGDYHFGHEEYEPAALLYQRALGVLEGAKKDVASAFAPHCLFSLAEVYAKWGLPDKAEATYRRELEIEMGNLGVSSFGTPFGLIGLGNLLRDQGRLEEIEPLAREAVSVLEGRLGPEHPEIVATLTYLAQIEGELDKNAEAERLLARAIAIQEKSLGPNHPQVANTLERYAEALQATGHEAEAAGVRKRLQQLRLQNEP